MHEFPVSPQYLKKIRNLFLSFFFKALFLLGMTIFIIFKRNLDPTLLLVLFGVLLLLSVYLGYQLLVLISARRSCIACDDDGIWLAHLDKGNGLVPWKDIRYIEERENLCCLDLQDFRFKKLLRIEFQLEEFDVLRRIIDEKTNLNKDRIQARHFPPP